MTCPSCPTCGEPLDGGVLTETSSWVAWLHPDGYFGCPMDECDPPCVREPGVPWKGES